MSYGSRKWGYDQGGCVRGGLTSVSGIYNVEPITNMEYRHPVWHGKTRMAWIHDGENISKISLFVLMQLMNVTDTDTA